ncbi:ArsR family transcriptional regulator [Thalassobacillus cyri]|uniref:ArsR family transcriptional regulator n=1 Tax=Thalassobacillus cyri TaxID=571932 RepID=A0A1H3XSM4_9BACI|nr:metalloregulator ArsR/SmtB family transcription factor [Thalassobacillus cyri]SEA02376.1 ArsR family transcriptional regulator [Thalassobacillus cyri]
MLKKTTAKSLHPYNQLFKMLNDPNRLRILLYLKNEELCVCNLMSLLDMSQPAVSQQLKKLREASLINMRRQNQWKFYRLNDNFPYLDLLMKILNELPDISHEIDALTADGTRVVCTVMER